MEKKTTHTTYDMNHLPSDLRRYKIISFCLDQEWYIVLVEGCFFFLGELSMLLIDLWHTINRDTKTIRFCSAGKPSVPPVCLWNTRLNLRLLDDISRWKQNGNLSTWHAARDCLTLWLACCQGVKVVNNAHHVHRWCCVCMCVFMCTNDTIANQLLVSPLPPLPYLILHIKSNLIERLFWKFPSNLFVTIQ